MKIFLQFSIFLSISATVIFSFILWCYMRGFPFPKPCWRDPDMTNIPQMWLLIFNRPDGKESIIYSKMIESIVTIDFSLLSSPQVFTSLSVMCYNQSSQNLGQQFNLGLTTNFIGFSVFCLPFWVPWYSDWLCHLNNLISKSDLEAKKLLNQQEVTLLTGLVSNIYFSINLFSCN